MLSRAVKSVSSLRTLATAAGPSATLGQPRWAERLAQSAAGGVAQREQLWATMADALTDNGHGLGPAADGKDGLPKTVRPRSPLSAPRPRRTRRPASPTLSPVAPALQPTASAAPRRVALPAPGGERWAEQVGARLEGALRRREELWGVLADALTDNGHQLGPAADGLTILPPRPAAMAQQAHARPIAFPATYADLAAEPPSDLAAIHDALQLKLARKALGESD